jgi:4-diphosphocytidyl-2-C-methyl-D-erythritol kinase
LLESRFLPLDPEGPLADRVEVELRDAPGVALQVEGSSDGVPADARNLAHRAASAFLERAGAARGAAVRLAKRVPAGAGLGGGSSDAGAVLRALEALLPGAVPASALREIALGLGADVPFFLDPRPARVSGIGERIAPEAGLAALPLIVAHPGISLATADVYRAFAASSGALTSSPPASTLPPLPFRPGDLDRAGWAERVRNDLEPAATALCPAVAALRTALRAAGALAVAMSGSGPACYGVFESEGRRDQALGRLTLSPPARGFATATQPSR